MKSKILLLSLAVASIVSTSLAQVFVNRDEYIQILVPLSVSVIPGAAGSMWFSYLYAYNNSDAPVDIHWKACTEFEPCSPAFRLAPRRTTTAPVLLTPADVRAGVLLWVPKSAAGSLALHSRIRDESRTTLNFGTEIPIIRENEFLTESAQLLRIPLDARFRSTLRVYDVDNRLTRFRVRLFGADETFLAETTLETTAPPTGGINTNIPRLAPYAAITDFRGQFPQMASHDFVRVEVQPVETGVRFWAFVSVTNNETQLVTTITPQ